MRRSLCVLAVLLLGLAPAARAQDPSGGLIGRRIRIQQHQGPTLQGAVVAVSDSAVTLRTSETDTVAVARTGIAKVEVYEGMKSNAGKGALKGLLIGALGGAIIGVAASGSDDGEFLDFGPAEWAASLGLTFGALGAGIGALVGSGSHHEKWQPTVLPTLKIQPAGQDGKRVALGLQIRF